MSAVERMDIPVDYQYPVQMHAEAERFRRTPKEVLTQNVLTHRAPNGVGLIVAHPFDVTDPIEGIERSDRLLVVDSPFANGPSEWAELATQFQADITGSTVARVMSTSKHGSHYDLSRKQWRDVKHGILDPIADKNLQAIESVFPTAKRLGFAGWSLAGAMALETALAANAYFDVLGAAAGDTPTAKQRGVLKLLGDFGKAGYPDLDAELVAANMDVFRTSFGFIGDAKKSDIQRMKAYGTDVLGQLHANLRIAQGLGVVSLPKVTTMLLERGIPVTLARAGDSAILPAADFEMALAEVEQHFASEPDALSKLRVMIFEATKHTGGDNMFKFGLLAQAALKTVLELRFTV